MASAATEQVGLLDAMAKNYQFYVFLFSMFVIFMGIARWGGKTISRNQEKARRKSANEPAALLASVGGDAEQSFTYTGLFKGGLIGLYLTAILLMYAVIMQAFKLAPRVVNQEAISRTDLLEGMPILLLFPVLMMPFLVWILLPKGSGRPVWVVIVICWAADAMALYFGKLSDPVAVVELLTTAILGLCMSYVIGMREGVKAADPTKSCPRVSVEVIEGNDLDRGWLYETTDTDYRLVTEDGANHIIPSSNVKSIRGPLA